MRVLIAKKGGKEAIECGYRAHPPHLLKIKGIAGAAGKQHSRNIQRGDNKREVR
jgi:hypothetical protein